MSTVTQSVMERLRDATHELHVRAERHPFQGALVRGALQTDAYIAYLGQMLCVHTALERRLRRHGDHAAINAVVKDHQYQEAYLEQDLRFFGRDPGAAKPLDGASALIGRIESASELELLGMHYVLEGSNNGSRFIAKGVARTLILEPGQPGLKYLDPYGDAQRERWQDFKDAMDDTEFGEEDVSKLINGAAAMFEGIVGTLDSLAREFEVVVGGK